MKKNIYFLGFLLLAACANDDEPTGQQVQNTYPLTIEVTENPLIPDGEEGSSTRAAITDNSSFATFYLNYKYGNYYPEDDDAVANDKQTLSKTSETWSGGSWPNPAVYPNYEVNWFAYTDGIFHFTDDNSHKAYINCVSDEFSSGQKDLLVATASGTYTGTNNGTLSFTFNHVCSAVRFQVKKSSNLGEHSLTVSSIVLKNVVKHGKYYYDTDTGYWELITTEASDFTDYTLYSGNDKTITSSYTCLNGTNEDNSYLFLIPQELKGDVSSGTYVEIAWKSNYGSNESGTAKIPLPKELKKGHRHDIKISIGTTTLTTHSGY